MYMVHDASMPCSARMHLTSFLTPMILILLQTTLVLTSTLLIGILEIPQDLANL